MARPTVVLAKQSQTVDLESHFLKIQEGKTYFDDGTTVFHVYIDAGLEDGPSEEVPRRPDTITVSYDR